MDDLDKVKAAIISARDVVISAHTNPDCDAIGASLGLALALKKMGKRVAVALEPYAEKFDIIPGKELLFAGDFSALTPDTFIALDAGAPERLGRAEVFLTRADVTLNIDHHVSNTGFAKINFVLPNVSSTSEIVFDLLYKLVELDAEIASALYAGIITDTGGFRYSNTTPETLSAAAKLVSFGIPFSEIYDAMMFTKSLREVKAFGKAVSSAEKIEGMPVCLAHISPEELDELGADSRDLDGVCESVRDIEGVEVAVFLYPKHGQDGVTKISLRSKHVPVGKIAKALGGGGHELACGADFSGTYEEARAAVLELLRRALL